MTQEIRIESKLNRQGICIGSALKWNKRRQVISEGKTLMIPASLYYTAPVKEPIYGSIWLYIPQVCLKIIKRMLASFFFYAIILNCSVI